MGLHRRYARLLKDAPQQMCLSKEEEQKIREQISSLFEGMMRTVYNQEGSSFEIGILSEPGVQNFIEGHAAVLDSAFQQVEMSDVMRQRLNRSDYIFSGMKTFHELNEAFPSLIDENGNRKSFEQFLNDVQSIDKTYNVNYLRAEYNFAQSSATMAAKWEQFMEDGDRYNLQYRTAHDGRVRPEHAALEGVTLPPSDSFWEEYYPPNGWNCRCTVIQVRKTKFPETDHEEAMGLGEEALQNDKKNMFHFNPGKEEKTFPDYNPYTIRRCKDCDIANGKAKLSKVYSGATQLCESCQFFRKCMENKETVYKIGTGEVRISKLVNSEDSDYKKLVQIADFFASKGATVRLTPKMTRPTSFQYKCIYGDLMGTVYEGKCPDLNINGLWYEHEGFVSKKPKNAFRNMMVDGLVQSNRIIIDEPDLTERYMLRGIVGRITANGTDIKEVWLRKADGEIKLLFKNTDG